MRFARAQATKKMHFRHNSMIAFVKGGGMKARKGDRRESTKPERSTGGVYIYSALSLH